MVALVTGASSGIGKDIAIELAKRNYDVILVARNEEKLNELKKNIEKAYNVKAYIKICDLSVANNCVSYMMRFIKSLDVLIFWLTMLALVLADILLRQI